MEEVLPKPSIKRVKSSNTTHAAEKEKSCGEVGDAISNKRGNRRRRSHKHPKDKKED